jgi:hypothetical protein
LIQIKIHVGSCLFAAYTIFFVFFIKIYQDKRSRVHSYSIFCSLYYDTFLILLQNMCDIYFLQLFDTCVVCWISAKVWIFLPVWSEGQVHDRHTSQVDEGCVIASRSCLIKKNRNTGDIIQIFSYILRIIVYI